ncbi:MAG: exodeoxyribonuclease III [Puniceicoccales bacterium]|jgi:exodeoxyribonuclease-3|nr:exodeoxyribonuclease III [Puniceicoccales bacterium]
MKIISWNVNGLRAILEKNFESDMLRLNPDILCLQEIKVKPTQLPNFDFLQQFAFKYFHSAERLGYSGTAVFSKKELTVTSNDDNQSDVANVLRGTLGEQSSNGLRLDHLVSMPDALIEPQEGRVQIADCKDFFLVNVYTPNVGAELTRLEFRHKAWDPTFCAFLGALREQKPVIVCGDFNVAHQEIDLASPERNHLSAGFTDEEREGFSHYIANGFKDIFRQFYPDKPGCYTWWSYRMAARQRNIGWRIDYFLASETIASQIKNIEIYTDVMGSDHAPIGIQLQYS